MLIGVSHPPKFVLSVQIILGNSVCCILLLESHIHILKAVLNPDINTTELIVFLFYLCPHILRKILYLIDFRDYVNILNMLIWKRY